MELKIVPTFFTYKNHCLLCKDAEDSPRAREKSEFNLLPFFLASYEQPNEKNGLEDRPTRAKDHTQNSIHHMSASNAEIGLLGSGPNIIKHFYTLELSKMIQLIV